MTSEEKTMALEKMPADFKPRIQADFMALYFEYERSFNRLSDEMAGKVIKRLYAYAHDYALSYDVSLQPDFDGLDAGAEMLLDMTAASTRRVYDARRLTAFMRSAGNPKKPGGRPSNT